MIKTRVLKPGDYYGQLARRREISGILLTEARYPEGHSTPVHTHERGYFAFVLQGPTETNQHQKHKTSHASTLVFHPPGILHQGQVRISGGRSFFVEIEPGFLKRIDDHLKLSDRAISFRAGLVTQLAARLYREFRHTDAASRVAVEGLVLEMLAQCARSKGMRARQRPRWLSEAREIIHDCYREDLSLSGVASLLGLHPVYVATEFRRFYDCNVGQYIRRVRIEAACSQLIVSSASLAEIAADLGFTHQAHFARIFKESLGLTPSEYRKHFRP